MSSPVASSDRKELAQAAFSASDVEASKAVHDGNDVTKAPETHGGIGSDFIKSIVFGGIDGTITTFSMIASTKGGSLSTEVILTLGFANLIADAISMGLGDFLSSKAEYDHLVAEKKREAWEFENYPEGECKEMVEILQGKGFDASDAETIISTIGKPAHKDFFVDYMMIEELGLEVPDDPLGPLKDGIVTLISFCIFGSIPLWVYLILWGAKYQNVDGIFGVSCAATALTLFALGSLQGRMAKIPVWKAGLSMTINGSLASAAAYLVGWGIMSAVGNGSGC